MKKLLFIINPCAGKKKAKRYLPQIEAIFQQGGYQVDTYMTTCQGDAYQIVQQKAASYDTVVCCGGDGTFNETVSGLLSKDLAIPLGYIPAGSTNDFANSLHLPKNFLNAARQIVSGTPTPIDVGVFGNRYFTYVASFGAFTKASYATPQRFKNAFGHIAYLFGGAKDLANLKKLPVKLVLDEEVLDDLFWFGAICNTTSVGGVLKIDPALVDMADGKFEVMLVRSPSSAYEFSECIQAIKRQKYDCKMITFRSASHIKILAPADMDWTLDGEHEKGHEQIEIVNKHHAIFLLK